MLQPSDSGAYFHRAELYNITEWYILHSDEVCDITEWYILSVWYMHHSCELGNHN